MNDKTEQSLADALRCTAAGGRAEIINVPGYPLMVRAVDYNTLRADLDRAIVNFGDAAATVCDMRAQLAEAQAALKIVMRNAELSKEPCGPNPESPAAIRNGKFAGLASIAAQGLGMVRGPSLTERLVEAQKDAERYSWLRMNRLWLKANLPTIAAPDFDATIDAAIDAAKGKTP